MLLFVTFCIVIIIQFYFYFKLFGKFSFSEDRRSSENENFSVSVVICARNEAGNLKRFLPYIAEQSYPGFEIVLVNDHSSDTTLKVFQAFKDRYKKNKQISDIKIVSLTEGDSSKGKKNALTKGIEAASNEYLLLTDADCRPVSKEWISYMMSKFNDKKNIVLGYGAYAKKKRSLFNKLIRFETLLTAIQYFSYAKSGMAYMGVGRNMAYTKSIFVKEGGFVKHERISSGDDDLFVNAVATKENTAICSYKDSFTESVPAGSFSEWFRQKRRHITTANKYSIKHRLLLGIFFLSQFLFYFLALILVFRGIFLLFVIFLILFRFVVWYVTISRSAKKLNEKDLIFLAPFYEIGIICLQLCIFISNLISPPKKW
jgi:cellulose synthase/poly-beta-1,6-N-acetylglucosamine synthase-like glycosyltransferase